VYWAGGSKDLVELLTAKGAAPISAIYLAARAGELDEVKRLVGEGADVNTRGKGSGGWTPLFAAVCAHQNDVDAAKFLIAKGADVNAKENSGMTPLHVACERGKRNMAELLIAEGADVNARDGGGCTPLHRMFYSGHNRLDIAELLLAKGADVNARLSDDWLTRLTPLHFAVESGDVRIVRLFIDNGAHINAPKTDGQTPLHIACECGHKDVVELLISKGADINAKDNKGKTALSLAKESGHTEIVELLRKHGAKQ
jgi:ankyrin repeat protein